MRKITYFVTRESCLGNIKRRKNFYLWNSRNFTSHNIYVNHFQLTSTADILKYVCAVSKLLQLPCHVNEKMAIYKELHLPQQRAFFIIYNATDMGGHAVA
jgi:hypothetical protein